MRSFNIDPVALYHVATGQLPVNTPVGRGKSAQGSFLVGFAATYPAMDKDTGLPHPKAGEIVRTEDGKRVKVNIRNSRYQGSVQSPAPPGTPSLLLRAGAGFSS